MWLEAHTRHGSLALTNFHAAEHVASKGARVCLRGRAIKTTVATSANYELGARAAYGVFTHLASVKFHFRVGIARYDPSVKGREEGEARTLEDSRGK